MTSKTLFALVNALMNAFSGLSTVLVIALAQLVGFLYILIF